MPSPIDILYSQIFGEMPKKDGVAYERFASAVCKLLAPHAAIFHDQRMRGEFSKSLYQLDVQIQKGQDSVFGEAKDYTLDERKVGRGDIQKLAGAIADLPVAGGTFFSATDYTKPAKQFSAAATEIAGKPIDLFHLRPVTEQDFEGRITSITVRLHILSPNFHNAFQPIWTDEGMAKLRATFPHGKQFVVPVEDLLDGQGNRVTSIFELTSSKYCEADCQVARGAFFTPHCFLPIEGVLIGIKGLEYTIPFSVTVQDITITSNGQAVLLVKDLDGKVDKLITAEDLKKVSFDEKNEARISRA